MFETRRLEKVIFFILFLEVALSKEVWKLNFRQYGEMKMQSRAAGAQR